VKACEALPDSMRDFGGEMTGSAAEFATLARQFGQVATQALEGSRAMGAVAVDLVGER
jgi:hypothetical protein